MSSISTALLGALFHDKVGRDLTPKINSYFDSEISPYLVTGGVFGILGTVGMVAALSLKNLYADPTQPWIYSLSIIKGFVIGAAAMAGAYFGDETPLNTAVESESTIELDLENVDQQIDI
jgi:H+/Cl- antiporter ClcA